MSRTGNVWENAGMESSFARLEIELLCAAPERFTVGAGCTVPGETSWHNLCAAIADALAHRQES